MTTPSETRSLKARAAERLTPWLVPVAILLGWQVAASTGLVSTRFMPAPSGVLAAGWQAAKSGELWTNLSISFARAAWASSSAAASASHSDWPTACPGSPSG